LKNIFEIFIEKLNDFLAENKKKSPFIGYFIGKEHSKSLKNILISDLNRQKTY